MALAIVWYNKNVMPQKLPVKAPIVWKRRLLEECENPVANIFRGKSRKFMMTHVQFQKLIDDTRTIFHPCFWVSLFSPSPASSSPRGRCGQGSRGSGGRTTRQLQCDIHQSMTLQYAIWQYGNDMAMIWQWYGKGNMADWAQNTAYFSLHGGIFLIYLVFFWYFKGLQV